ncbi:MAG: hypothetical protein M3R02_23020 [Chloroflexota bacterium]|nr:hypothetical protein [Chloroflexota bacterium]
MTIPYSGGDEFEPRPTPVPYTFHAVFMTDDELINDAIALADLTILANKSTTDGLQSAMPPAARFKEARNLTWRIILTRRAWRGESPWPTFHDRLRGCRLPGRPCQIRSSTRRPLPPEDSACPGDPADANSGGDER